MHALNLSNLFIIKIETNAKIVQWSDGTYSLAIGDEFFEI